MFDCGSMLLEETSALEELRRELQVLMTEQVVKKMLLLELNESLLIFVAVKNELEIERQLVETDHYLKCCKYGRCSSENDPFYSCQDLC